MDAASACMSVLATTNWTSPRPAAIMLLTTLPPAPPTPITVISGFVLVVVGHVKLDDGHRAHSWLPARHQRAAPAGELLDQPLDHSRRLTVAGAEAQAPGVVVAPGRRLPAPCSRADTASAAGIAGRRGPEAVPSISVCCAVRRAPALLAHLGDDGADQQVVETTGRGVPARSPCASDRWPRTRSRWAGSGLSRPSAALIAASEKSVRPGGQSIRMKSNSSSSDRNSSPILDGGAFVGRMDVRLGQERRKDLPLTPRHIGIAGQEIHAVRTLP